MARQCNQVGIEEDIIKCLRPTCLDDFRLKGMCLRSKGLNGICMFVFSHVRIIFVG